MKRKGTKPQQPTAEKAGTLALLPMEIQIGDRFIDGEVEWELVTHPAGFQGGKSLRARIRRPGVPESETEMIWPVCRFGGRNESNAVAVSVALGEGQSRYPLHHQSDLAGRGVAHPQA